ncbi:MAG TPA: ABC transporter substrate-binding protein [Chloroflexota bacterium]|nr:ABC transporter substrate-binding protein [Chloroflexota bacterium]HZU06018.1 ABC transporter substrate-binding protein [Chloroflexota bacterium]
MARWQLLSGLLGLVLASACGPAASAPPASPPPAAQQPAGATPTVAAGAPASLETVRIAETSAIAYAPVYIAEARGYYREQGLTLEFENFAGGADALPALARGDFDLNLGAISAGTFHAIERGLDIKIVAPMGILPLRDSALPLLVRKDLVDSGTVTTVGDLRGRRVAVNTRGAIVEYLLTKVLEREGLTIRDVEEVTLPFPDHATAFASGAIDASITAEPFATRALSQGVASKFIAEIAPGRMTTVVMYSGRFIRERPEVARRWMVATMRGARELQGPELGVTYPEKFYTPENLAVFEQHLGVSAQVIRDQVPYTWDPDLELQVDFILDQQLVHIRNGVLQLAQPLPAERLVDESFVRYAQQVLGKVRS